MITFRIQGLVKEQGTGMPLPGLRVKAFDKDLVFDDVLGSAVSGHDGVFEITCELKDFREFLERKPDLYFKVYRAGREAPIHSTENAVLWNVGRFTGVAIEVPPERLQEPKTLRLGFAGEDGQAREEFEVGESLVIHAEGLRPARAYDVTATVEGRTLFSSRLLTNRLGELEPTALWPQMGLDDLRTDKRYTIDEARRHWAGKTVTLALLDGKTRLAEQRLRLADAFTRPLVLCTDRDGRLLNGFEAGTQALYVTLRNLPFTGRARIMLVARQHDWHVGDAFEAAALADGRPAVRDVDVPAQGATLEVAAAALLRAGAYDFIVRPLRYGYEDNDEPRIRHSDVVGGRWTTGVVIRDRFMESKTVLGGCVNNLPISCRHVAGGAPYLRYSDTFAVGEPVYAALDPAILPPANLGKMCALYVIQNRDADPMAVPPEWTDNSLQHLPALGGNPAVQRFLVQAWCVNQNKRLVWPAAQEGQYDIVADFGSPPTPDAAAFAPDNQFNTPNDIVDGYFEPGFRVVRDPGTLTEFPHAGAWSYDPAAVNAMGLQGNPTVQDDAAQYHSGGSTTPWTVSMRANVRFPADVPGATPAQMSTARPDYPLVVVIHGNGHSYASYDFLLDHLARNGFIAASIHLEGDMNALGRANVFFRHLAVLQARFGARVQNNIGIMGHSRGGEAVLKAARLNQQLGLGHGINAIISLAPTDQYGRESLAGAWATPYFVLYGSRDGDINGDIWVSGYTVPQTGFALYDRADGAPKSMVFVHRATHNGFITDNEDWSGDADYLSRDAQRRITLAYMNAFFRQHLRNEGARWRGMFTGEWTPPSVAADAVDLFVQYRDTNRRVVDHFEGAAPDWQASTIGGTVTHDATLPVDPAEGKMHDHPSAPGLDPRCPHDTKGLRVRWDNAGDRLVFTVPVGQRDVSSYPYLSVRIGQRDASASNPAGMDQDLRLALRDAAGNERAVRVAPFTRLPYPEQRATPSLRKSAMTTVRIPLKSYTIVCAGQPQVNLADVVRVELRFSERATGEIGIDELEFTH